MKRSLVLLSVTLLLSTAPVAAARRPMLPRAVIQVDIRNPIELGIRGILAKLSPDGKRILCVQLGEPRKYAYHILSVDGKKTTKVFDSTIGWGDPFVLCLRHGVWSPDGKRFAALTSHDGRPYQKGGKHQMLIFDIARKKQTPLPCELGETMSAVFDAKGSVYYVDMLPIKHEVFRGMLKKYNPETGVVSTVRDYGNAAVCGLTMSPDRSRIGGFIIRSLGPRARRPEIRLWAHDIASKADSEGKSMGFHDYFGGAPHAFWGAGGTALYANAAAGFDKQRPFSIVRFEPFPAAKRKTTLLQQGKSMLTACAFAPGKLSVADDSRGKESKAYVLDLATGRKTPALLPLLLIDRRGSVGLFMHTRTRKLHVATIVMK